MDALADMVLPVIRRTYNCTFPFTDTFYTFTKNLPAIFFPGTPLG